MVEVLCKRCEISFDAPSKHKLYCDSCRHNLKLEKTKEYYNKNKEKVLNLISLWKEKNPERMTAIKKVCDKRYRIKHKEKITEYQKKYQEINKNKIKQYNKEYSIKYRNTEYGKNMIRQNNRNRRAKERKIVELFTIEEWLKILECTCGICPQCEKNVGIEYLTLDHIYPISKAENGRIYTINDIQPLCRSCNARKGAKWLM